MTSTPSNSYIVNVSTRFVYLTLSCCILLAYIIGQSSRNLLLKGKFAILAPHDSSVLFVRPDYHEGMWGSVEQKESGFPTPKLASGKQKPKTTYTGKTYDTSASATITNLHLEHVKDDYSDSGISINDSNDTDSFFKVKKDGMKECSLGKSVVTDGGNSEDNVNDKPHLPAGQHLLVDIKNIDGEFLNSEERLAQAMVSVVVESKLTLLSYHCHSLIPMGVSCVGVLLESHISFHTWPEEGVITLDLYTCGNAPLVPVLPIIERLFAIPRIGRLKENPKLVWSHKLRGWGKEGEKKFLGADVGREVLEKMNLDMKEEIISTTTKFQRIDIYDIIYPTMRDYHSYNHTTPTLLYRPDRVVYLDGIHQSSRYGLEPYHEALVHPAMFSHPNPKTAAIIGGGEGATLREVLKHNTIEHVRMIEIDEDMVQVSREHLSEWSDCSDIHGSASWCGNDPRAEITYEDALNFFIQRRKGDISYDIIIIDALDPQDNVPFAEVLYKNDIFLQALFDSLSLNGVMAVQLGMAPSRMDPSEELGINKNRDYLKNSLVRIGFQSLHIYHEPHCLFEKPWTYIVAMKDSRSRQLWYQNRPQIDLQIHQRIKRSNSGQSTLKYFDSTVMKSYEVPNKVYETVFCRKVPTPESCHQFDDDSSLSIGDLEVRQSQVGDNSGRGLFTKVDISKNTPIGLPESIHNVFFPSSTVYNMEDVIEYYEDAPVNAVYEYMDGYGWEINMRGLDEYGVDASILCFANHGCNGSHNIDEWQYNESDDDLTEENVTLELMKQENFRPVYDPYIDRHLPHMFNDIEYASRDIKAGEELLCNYVDYSSNDDEFGKDMADLRAVCSGISKGYVTSLEEEKKITEGE